MSTWSRPIAASAGSVSFAEAQRAFMARVYLWMFIGLGLTAATAFATAATPALYVPVMRNFFLFAIVELGLVFVLSMFAMRLSGAVAGLLFLAYSGLNGLTLSGIFFVYRIGSIADALALTAAVFGAMSLFATVTKRDLSGWSAFLFMGLIGVLVAGVINLFVRSDGLSFVVSCACVVVFAGLTAYDTQKLRTYFASAYAGGGVGSLAVVGALELYLDFVNLFLSLLRLFGRRR